MRNIFVAFVLSGLVFACGNEKQKVGTDLINSPVSGSKDQKNIDLPEVTFSEQRYDFGSISQGEIVRHTFEITNTGDAPLLINDVSGECSCTVLEDWEKDPIQPGEKTTFTAVFDSGKKEGKQNVRVFVSANTHPVKNVVVMVGKVIIPE